MSRPLNKRYSHDGMSFKGFIAGPTLPYCAQISGSRSGDGGRGVAHGR